MIEPAPPRRRAAAVRVVLVERPRRVVDRQVAERPGLGVGVLEDRPPAGLDEEHLARAQPAAADGLRGRRAGRRPASDATATSRSRRHREGAGRRPLRSMSAPTRRPSAKTIAAGPSHGASIPAVRRRSVATCGCGRAAQRRAPRGSPRAAPGRGPSRSSSAARGPRRATASRSRPATAAARPRAARRRSAGPPGRARPPADLLAVAADRVDLAVVGDRPERLGERPGRACVRRVALVEERVRHATGPAGPGRGRPGGRRRRGPCRRSSGTSRRDRQLGEAPPAARGDLQPPPGDDQPTLERPSSATGRAARRARRAGRSTAWATADATPRRRPAPRRSTGTSRQATTGRPGVGERPLDERPRPRGGGAAARQEQHRRRPAAPRRRLAPGDQPRGPSRLERERDARPVARLAVGPERAAMGQRREPGQRQRQDPRRDRPPASATNPTPHASCSKRGS